MNDKACLLKFRLYLIEGQKRILTGPERIELNEILEHIYSKDLHGVDLPDEYDSLESFIIKMKLNNLKGNRDHAQSFVKRSRNRKPNPFLS